MDEQEINSMNRQALTEYLEAWGYQVYDHETTQDLRQCALDNFKTEGA